MHRTLHFYFSTSSKQWAESLSTVVQSRGGREDKDAVFKIETSGQILPNQLQSISSSKACIRIIENTIGLLVLNVHAPEKKFPDACEVSNPQWATVLFLFLLMKSVTNTHCRRAVVGHRGKTDANPLQWRHTGCNGSNSSRLSSNIFALYKMR